MRKGWIKRLCTIEAKSKSLHAEEFFEVWLSENYPGQQLSYGDYMDMVKIAPEEFKWICFDRCMQEIRNLQTQQI